jgi:hypothetical protein
MHCAPAHPRDQISTTAAALQAVMERTGPAAKQRKNTNLEHRRLELAEADWTVKHRDVYL